jgi:hypothetical protein
MDRNKLAQDRIPWWDHVNTDMNLKFYIKML